MSIERALIKFKGDVRAAAEYILAGAPLKPPEYVLKGGLFYPLFLNDYVFEARANGSTSIQDKDTYILEKDLEDFNFQYPLHAQFEDDSEFTSTVENLINTYRAPAEVSLIPLPVVLDRNTEEVNYLEFEPKSIKQGPGDKFLFSFDVNPHDRRKQTEKTVYMELDTAQLYLERRATERNEWLLPGLLVRLISELKEGSFNADQWRELQAFSKRNFVTFGTAPLWSGRYFVDGQQFKFTDKDLDSVYESLRDRATSYNQSPKYLLFQMVENSVDDLFQNSEQQERRIELNSILDGIIEREGLRSGPLTTLKSFIGPEAYMVLHPEELHSRNYLTFGQGQKLWSGEYFVDGEQITFTDKILYSRKREQEEDSTEKNVQEKEVYRSLKGRATDDNPSPQYLLFQMVENSVEDLFKDDLFKDIEKKREQQARRMELYFILESIIREEGLVPLERFISRKAYKVLTQL